ncbi:hypothetical protein NKH18_12835 [Streptomyces sp. M10(2022)]
MFEGQPAHALFDHGGEFAGSGGSGEEEFRLVLGEYTAGGAERGDERGDSGR